MEEPRRILRLIAWGKYWGKIGVRKWIRVKFKRCQSEAICINPEFRKGFKLKKCIRESPTCGRYLNISPLGFEEHKTENILANWADEVSIVVYIVYYIEWQLLCIANAHFIYYTLNVPLGALMNIMGEGRQTLLLCFMCYGIIILKSIYHSASVAQWFEHWPMNQ